MISTTTQNNGIVGLYEIPDRNIFKNAITIACDGTPLTTFYHPYEFTAKDNVIVFNLSNKIKLATVFYIIMEINRVKWRFSYGRKCYLNKVDKIKILLPCKNNKEIDDEYIERLMKSFSGWKLVKKIISKYN